MPDRTLSLTRNRDDNSRRSLLKNTPVSFFQTSRRHRVFEVRHRRNARASGGRRNAGGHEDPIV